MIFNIKLKAEKITPKTQGLAAVLGQKGIKPMDFCNEYNTFVNQNEKHFWKPGCTVIVKIEKGKIEGDFEIEGVSTCIVSEFIKEKMQLEAFSKKPGKIKMTKKVPKEILEELAKIKARDFNTDDLSVVYKSLIGTIKTMGLEADE